MLTLTDPPKGITTKEFEEIIAKENTVWEIGWFVSKNKKDLYAMRRSESLSFESKVEAIKKMMAEDGNMTFESMTQSHVISFKVGKYDSILRLNNKSIRWTVK